VASAAVKKTLWQAIRQQRELEAFVVPHEERPQSKLRLREPGDRILVLRYLYETRANGGIDREQCAKPGALAPTG